MKSTEVMNNPETKKTLVKLEKKAGSMEWVEWVVVRGWNPDKPEGQKWDSGEYFTDLEEAARRLKER